MKNFIHFFLSGAFQKDAVNYIKNKLLNSPLFHEGSHLLHDSIQELKWKAKQLLKK